MRGPTYREWTLDASELLTRRAHGEAGHGGATPDEPGTGLASPAIAALFVMSAVKPAPSGARGTEGSIAAAVAAALAGGAAAAGGAAPPSVALSGPAAAMPELGLAWAPQLAAVLARAVGSAAVQAAEQDAGEDGVQGELLV